MSNEIHPLFRSLKELRKLLAASVEKAGEASAYAHDLGGEFDQEISTDMGTIQEKLSEILDDLDSSIGESKTLLDDEKAMEKSLESGLDDEENYKTDSERIQEEIEETEEEEEREEEKKA